MYASDTSLYLYIYVYIWKSHTKTTTKTPRHTAKKLVHKKQMRFFFAVLAVLLLFFLFFVFHCAGFILKRVFNCLPCYFCCCAIGCFLALTTIS